MAPRPLSRRLLKHGIEACSTRNPALLALAAELPAPILADLLGTHVSTAAESQSASSSSSSTRT